ncbi:MAG: hypothetical protein U0324_46925 [Polyangiales bacterium]
MGAGTRDVRYPWRLTWRQAEILRATERYLVLVAGRRFGKTILAVAWLVMEILSRPPGALGYYVLPYRVMAKAIAWDALKQATRGLRVGKANESELCVDLPGGRKIALKGADDPETLEGVALSAAVLDEFARMKLAAWERSLRPALSDKQGRVLFIGKPRGRNHLKDFYERGRGATRRRGWRSWLYRTCDGGFVPQSDIDEARRDLPPRIFRQEYEASFEVLAGRIYEEFSREYRAAGHVVRAAEVPAEFNRVSIGIDWGFTHPGVATALGEAAGGKVYVAAEEFHREFRIPQWEAALKRLKGRFPGADWFADPSRPDLIASFSQSIGVAIEPAENDVMEGILEVMKLVHPREDLGGPILEVSDACPNVIDGLDGYLWATDAEGNSIEKPLKVGDDAADSVRYSAMGLRRKHYVGAVDDDWMDR